jgi:MoCo/4Fe-4S cofactor protein with predicted Tat translocation signal
MTTPPQRRVARDLPEIRARLAGERGPRFWRSLEELAGSAEFEAFVRVEFPEQAEEWSDAASRRQFLRLMGASLALAGVSGCAFQPAESIVPAVEADAQVVPGRPLFFATAVPLDGYATGVLVESHMGRPTKIEGNPDHPAGLGGTDAFAQAEILGLYDPDRSQVVTHNGRVSTWDDFLAALIAERGRKLASKGAGLRILTEAVASPTLAHQIARVKEQFPESRWHQYEPVGLGHAREGARVAFGTAVVPVHHFDKADVILSLDADFLTWNPARLRDARAFTARRETTDRMNRLYVVEPTPTITGAMADHRLPLPSRRIAGLAQAVAHELGIEGAAAAGAGPAEQARWVAAVAADLKAHCGSSLVLAGPPQPPEVHALAHALNHALGNVGKTVEYYPEATEGAGDLRALVADMAAGRVDALLILGGNPAYDAPADVDFAGALAKLPRGAISVRLGLYDDETSALCRWHVPEAHVLEAWGDARAFDGTATIQQPLIAPLYGGKSAIELLSALLGQPARPALEIVRDYWKGRKLADDFEPFWRDALHDGVVAGTADKPKDVAPKSLAELPKHEAGAEEGMEIVFRPDPTIWDGRFANNGWLQELPKPITRLTWDNAALVSPATAVRLGLKVDAMEDTTEVVRLSYRGRSLRLPVWIVPGQADDAVTVHLGYGRTRAGRVGDGLGASAYALRTAAAPWFDSGLKVAGTGERARLAAMQHHQLMENRHLVRVATIGGFRAKPDFAHEGEEEPGRDYTLYKDPEPQRRHEEQGEGNAWGMAINLNTCIGCGACVVACQAENNIPVVGKEQVIRGRNMHWIRIDRYYEGEDKSNPPTYFQPVPCMHCEKAPCELVCPVGATLHDAEGLNVMIYNRCVGTRYCSNNCPYKVRRFNFLEYNGKVSPSERLQKNPEVTVRSRGVMEKCSYCLQRITLARIAAEEEGRTTLRDGEVTTACAQACPTRAIAFGNLNDRQSEVVRLKQGPRNYGLLEGLNTRPRTTYLAKLINPGEATGQAKAE